MAPPPPLDETQTVLYEGQKATIVQTEQFVGWMRSLRDRSARARITDRLARVSEGNLGDWKALGDGLCELRLAFGPGYRVYFVRKGHIIIVLLCGGDKASQTRDIKRARLLAAEVERHHEADSL